MPIIIDACFVLDLLWTFNASNLHCRDKIIGFHSLIFYFIPLWQWDLKKPFMLMVWVSMLEQLLEV